MSCAVRLVLVRVPRRPLSRGSSSHLILVHVGLLVVEGDEHKHQVRRRL
jgi:hypothetical protein